ncbi:hypothetical protein ACHAQH_007437 [Verticillium albo-atrum]
MGDYHYKHDELGEVIGLLRGNDVVQFRGIPFATIPARFRQSSTNEKLPSQPFDARQPGPFCPQVQLPPHAFWDQPPGEDYPKLTPSTSDEYACLNLNITAPREVLENGGKANVPVLVFIHGGAFICGSQCIAFNGREIFDGTDLVTVSRKRNQPIVFVTINYRLGALGFLASRDLAAYNRSHNEPVGNYGLHDQARALDWISTFIRGFGGDPEQVTLHGTSAGSISTHYQSLFPDRKFKRAILSSGNLVGLGPKSMDEHEITFAEYVTSTAGSGASDKTKVELLQAVNAQDLIDSVPGFITYPLIDEEWVRGNDSDSLTTKNPPEIMIGSCAYEQDITEFLLGHVLATKSSSEDAFLSTIQDMLCTNGLLRGTVDALIANTEVRKAYGIPETGESSADSMKWASLVADLMFRIPLIHMASTMANQPMLLYEISATNPFTNSAFHYQKANHGINDILLFDVAEDAVPQKHLEEWRGAVAAVQETWLDFCHGLTPWPVATGSGESLGPFYRIDNTSGGVICGNLAELVGETTAKRWSTVLREVPNLV